MKLKLISLERLWFWLNFWRGDFFMEALILRGNKAPPWKGKCPPGWMNCRWGETRWEESFGNSHMPSKTAKNLHKWSFWCPSSCSSLLSSWMGGGEGFCLLWVSDMLKLSLAEQSLEKTLCVIHLCARSLWITKILLLVFWSSGCSGPCSRHLPSFLRLFDASSTYIRKLFHLLHLSFLCFGGFHKHQFCCLYSLHIFIYVYLPIYI